MFSAFLAICMGIYQLLYANPIEHKIDDYLKKQHFQGAAFVAQDGKILLCKGYGEANLEHQIPNTPDTIFRIASMTKQFTAVAILQLQERGLLNVHDPINTYLPDYPRGDEITIHHLLTHTSGIPGICDFSNLSEIQRFPSTTASVIAHFKDLPLNFSPGTDCEYSDSGYILLGAIIEVVSAMSYEEYVTQNIFQHLAMQNSFYDHNQSIIRRRATGYNKNRHGNIVHAEFIEMSFPHAAGALASTVKDLYLFIQALENETLLSKKSVDLLFKVHASSFKNELAYGYGFYVGPLSFEMQNAFDDTIVGHDGEIEGFRAILSHYLNHKTTIILLSNLETTDKLTLQKEIASLLFHTSWR